MLSSPFLLLLLLPSLILSLSFQSPAAFCTLLLLSSPSSSHLHPPSPLPSWKPHSTPLKGPPPRSFAPQCPLATSSRPVAARPLLACASSRLSFNLKSLACTPNHYNQPITLPLYMLHIINYQPRSLFLFLSKTCSSSFAMPSRLVLPSTFFLDIFNRERLRPA